MNDSTDHNLEKLPMELRFEHGQSRNFGDCYDRDVLQSFSTVRTTVRLRELNKELKNAERDQLGMRDYKQLGQLQTIRLSEVPNPYEEQARRALEEAGISY